MPSWIGGAEARNGHAGSSSKARRKIRFGDEAGLAVLLVVGILWLAGCSPGLTRTPGPPPPAPTRIPLVAFASATPTPGDGATPTRQISPTPPPSATPTPFRYQIVEGDTLIGIAFRFGIETQALLAANPGIDPQFLTIGDSLVIPLEPSQAEAGGVPTPAPGAILSNTPDCYPSTDGGLWCLLAVENQGNEPLENLVAIISIYDSAQVLLDSRPALAALNLLPPGERLPLLAWFPPPAAGFDLATAALQSALPVPADDARYLPGGLVFETELDGGRALVRGSFTLQGDQPASRIWISVAAFDIQGSLIGVRRLELEGEFLPGAAQPFEVEVFSLGGEIGSVEVLSEARP